MKDEGYLAGRRILKDYFMAKDEDELSRLNLQHRVFHQAAGRRFLAPVRRPRRILDLGCGTGIWSWEVASYYQQAKVIGLDMDEDPITRARAALPSHVIPRNFAFIKADALAGLPFEDNGFDLVYARFISSFVPIPAWPTMLAELVRVTKPGGYVECTENGFPAAPTGPLQAELSQAALVLFQRLQIGVIGPSLPARLQEAGLIDIHQQDIVLRGKGLAKNLYFAVENMRPMFLKSGVLSAKRFDELCNEALYQEMLLGKAHLPVVVAWGAKPHPNEPIQPHE